MAKAGDTEAAKCAGVAHSDQGCFQEVVTASSPQFILNPFNSCFSQNWQLFPTPAVNDSGGASGLFLFSHQEVVIGKVQAPGVLQRPAELPALHPSRPQACYTHRGVSAAGGPAPVTGRGARKHPREKRRSLLFFFQYTAFGTALSCCCEWHRTRDGQLRARGCSGCFALSLQAEVSRAESTWELAAKQEGFVVFLFVYF